MIIYFSIKIHRFLSGIDSWIRLYFGKLLPKNLSLRYLLAVGFVALLAIVGQTIIQVSLSRQANDHRVLRSLQIQIHDSENLRTAVLTLHLTSRKNGIRSQTNLIHFFSSRLKQNDYLFSENPFLSEKDRVRSEELQELLQKEQQTLNNLLEDCHELVHAHSVQVDHRLLIAGLLQHESAYRGLLWKIGQHYEYRIEQQLVYFRRATFVVLFIVLGVLMLEALYIFRPAIENLYEALKIRSHFLGRMSHEIRNPMNSILGMVNLLFETPLSDQQKKYLSILYKSSTGLLDMLNNLLDFSSMDAGTLKIEKIPFDLYKLLEKTVDSFVFEAHAKGIEVVLHLEPNVPLEVIGDSIRIQQILTNLMGNAIKFTQQGEVVLHVLLKSTGEVPRIEFAVIDTGIGIDRRKLHRIFQAFVQEDSSVRRRFGGVGLGLAISKELVHSLGGKLKVESQKNEGSRFYFSIPLPVSRETTIAHIIQEKSFSKYSALIAEPNDHIFHVLSEILLHTGAMVRRPNQTNVLRTLLLSQGSGKKLSFPEILILDYEFLKNDLDLIFSGVLRSEIEKMRIIFLIKTTALSQDIEKLATYGVRNFIFKPIKPTQLLQIVLESLKSSELSTLVGPESTLGVESAPNPWVHDKKLKILAVDDSRENRFLMEAYLSTLPCEISLAENGRIAFEQFKQQKFDVVLMDLQMPEMDGYSAAQLMYDWEGNMRSQRTPIIAISAHDHETAHTQTKPTHFVGYLVKPIAPEQLRKEIMKFLNPSPSAQVQESPQAIIDDEIAQELMALAPAYLEKRSEEVSVFYQSAQKGDFKNIRFLSHRVKGNAKSYGFAELGLIAAALEDAAKQEDPEAVVPLIQKMEHFLQGVRKSDPCEKVSHMT